MGVLRHPEKLKGVDSLLQGVILEAVGACPFDCVVSEGVRSAAQAIVNYRHGRTATELAAVGIHDAPLPGPQITWTLHSKHVDGKAVDLFPLLPNGSLDDGTGSAGFRRFDALYHAVMAAAAKRAIRVRYGGDWDQDGKLREKGERDSPHFELS